MVKALDIHGKPFVMEAFDGSLLARAIQHENDHLDGILFIDHCASRFEMDEVLKEHNLRLLEPDKLLDEPEIDKELEQEQRMIKIVFFGTPKIAVKSLEYLNNSKDFEVAAVVTQPDKPAGRGKKLSMSPVKRICSFA